MISGGDDRERESTLSELKNIGKVTERWLNGIGIYDEAELRRVGAVQAYQRIRACEAGATENLLYALQGALSGTHWNDLPLPVKEMLRRQAERHDPTPGRR